ncbi:hypothetical protein Patl1_10082 [Pistacia atlantica]|uniref:Uncharacterized protein n=1 Tax=Pistacia atlantica TaxID=434234 RepID=A0ACC1A4U4_9ROSI|nr:hypothetical protein Patl1_10082 [Pistacia atlantica]
MQKFHSLASFILPSCYVILLPFVGCSSHEEFSQSSRNHKISKEENIHKVIKFCSIESSDGIKYYSSWSSLVDFNRVLNACWDTNYQNVQ